MAGVRYLLASTTLTGTTTSVTFSNIPQTGYTDLKVVASVRTAWATDTNDQFRVQFNGDTTTNYSYREINGNGSAIGSGYASSVFVINPQTNTSAMTSSTFASHDIYIPNYTGSTTKSVSSDNVTENNATLSYQMLYAGLWNGTAAINSITFLTFRGSGFVSGSTFSLYGIKAS